MRAGRAMLGESIELYKEASEWGKDRKKCMAKNEKARAIISESLAPMLEEKRKAIASRKSD